MESRLFSGENIYWKLREQYAEYSEHCFAQRSEPHIAPAWGEFIQHMNMGIVWRDDLGFDADIYEIINPQTWLLAKIKHGI